MEEEPPVPSLKRAVSYDAKIHETINARKNKYMDAAQFCMKVVGNKTQAMKHVNAAE